MKRRQFVIGSAAALAAVTAPALAAGDQFEEFTQAGYEQKLASGEPFMLDFFASW